jgi:hypothetical protein
MTWHRGAAFTLVGVNILDWYVTLGGAFVLRRSNALFDRVLSSLGEVGCGFVFACCRCRNRSGLTVLACLLLFSISSAEVVYRESVDGLRFNATEDSGSIDLGFAIVMGSDNAVSGRFFSSRLTCVGGVTFSLRLSFRIPLLSVMISSLLFDRVFGSYFDVRLVLGAEKSEYTLGLGVVFEFEEDEPELWCVGVCDVRWNCALALLELRLDLIKGNRSFIRADFGVLFEDVEVEEVWLNAKESEERPCFWRTELRVNGGDSLRVGIGSVDDSA